MCHTSCRLPSCPRTTAARGLVWRQVLSGFAVQETALRLAGRGVFPLWEWFVRRVCGVEATLPRYRVHM